MEFEHLRKIMVLPSGTLSQNLDLEKFRHGTSIVTSVVNLNRPTTIAICHVERPFCVQELIRRWDSERELLRSPPQKLPEFAEMTQNNGHYAVLGHSMSPILVPIESSYTMSY